MALANLARTALACLVATVVVAESTATRAQGGADAPLAFKRARVSIAGTSNIHPYTASTTTVRITRAQLAAGVAGPAFWDDIVKPGALAGFEVSIPAGTLASTKDGLDKNMHKALRVEQHPEIVFRLLRIEPAAAGALKAVGVLRVAGVERDVALAVTTRRNDSTLSVKGEVTLLMTDFGIKPPTAMLGMLKTDPKVTVTFETVLMVPLT